MAYNKNIFISTSDTASLVSLTRLFSSYSQECQMIFERDGFGIRTMTSDKKAFLTYRTSEEDMLFYRSNCEYNVENLCVELKELLSTLQTVPNGATGYIYTVGNNDDIFINKVASDADKAFYKVKVLVEPEMLPEIPDITYTSPECKLSNNIFSTLCLNLGRKGCDRVDFSFVDGSLTIRGFRGTECVAAQRLVLDGESEEFEEVSSDVSEPKSINSGRIKIKVYRKQVQEPITVSFKKLKPLAKIKTITKNGITKIQFGKFKNNKDVYHSILCFQFKINQIGVSEVYFLEDKGDGFEKQVSSEITFDNPNTSSDSYPNPASITHSTVQSVD